MKKSQGGFSLIELMIVIAIIGILSLIAMPAYQDYTKRAYVSEGLQLATPFKIALLENFHDKGDWLNGGNGATPEQVNAELGLDAPTSYAGQAVKSIHVVGVDDASGDGVRVIITFNERVVNNGMVYVEAIQYGTNVGLTVQEWKCGSIYVLDGSWNIRKDILVEERWLPAVCRGNPGYGP